MLAVVAHQRAEGFYQRGQERDDLRHLQPEDKLIIEGYPTLDARFPGITVLATSVTTRNLQVAKRRAQEGSGR